jgi:hypothetical protein
MSGLHTAENVALEIENRLKTITIASGCETDIGLHTYRGRTDINDDMVPCAVVIEGDDRVDQAQYTQLKLVQRYALVGYAHCDAAHPNDAAHKMLRDLKRSIFAKGAQFDRKVKLVEYAGRTIGKRADSVPIVMVVLEIDVTYVEDLANP